MHWLFESIGKPEKALFESHAPSLPRRHRSKDAASLGGGLAPKFEPAGLVVTGGSGPSREPSRPPAQARSRCACKHPHANTITRSPRPHIHLWKSSSSHERRRCAPEEKKEMAAAAAAARVPGPRHKLQVDRRPGRPQRRRQPVRRLRLADVVGPAVADRNLRHPPRQHQVSFIAIR